MKAIKVCLSDSEYAGVEKMVKAGIGRTKSDFVRTAVLMHTNRCEAALRTVCENEQPLNGSVTAGI